MQANPDTIAADIRRHIAELDRHLQDWRAGRVQVLLDRQDVTASWAMGVEARQATFREALEMLDRYFL